MACTQNKEGGGKTIRMKRSSRSFFTLACDTFFMPPQSGRSHTFSPFIYIIGGSENIINDQQLIESAGEQRERVCGVRKKSVGTIACKLGEYTRRCSAISLPVDLSNFSLQLMPSFPASLTSHITLLQTRARLTSLGGVGDFMMMKNLQSSTSGEKRRFFITFKWRCSHTRFN